MPNPAEPEMNIDFKSYWTHASEIQTPPRVTESISTPQNDPTGCSVFVQVFIELRQDARGRKRRLFNLGSL